MSEEAMPAWRDQESDAMPERAPMPLLDAETIAVLRDEALWLIDRRKRYPTVYDGQGVVIGPHTLLALIDAATRTTQAPG